jgi:NAD(P)-dependent dehydrogenase (short-subunit alcohol dehydrogenase family)
MRTTGQRLVLVTGAAGRIGSYFAEQSKSRYRLRLMVREGETLPDTLAASAEVVVGDVGDLERMKQVCEGVDTVLHLAANPSPTATWEELLPTNIIGTYHTFVAAKAAGCRRVVYASSIHAVSGYPRSRQVRTGDPVNPGDLYGVSKCFGEALACYMAEQEGLSCIAVRIGAFQPLEAARDEANLELLDAFVSDRDLCRLLERCVDAEDIGFAIVHGLSDNVLNVMDLTDTQALLGYQPQDSFSRESPRLKELKLDERLQAHNRSAQESPSGLREDI